MNAHAKKFQTNWAAKATSFMCMRKHARMRRHERPESLDVHVEKKIMLEIIPTHVNETTKKLLCMRKHDSMPYHAMPYGARMRHAMRDMYACATINITCYDVYV